MHTDCIYNGTGILLIWQFLKTPNPPFAKESYCRHAQPVQDSYRQPSLREIVRDYLGIG